ncbi:zinc finger BED domain-containing protein RICESLEEPER 1-like [Elaeis guineensis]|uniref:zinc finger BED domain-containing protein RICESLEEPER 1-like n=1 Tax=Elaeis guineensis var. tenera TaxID=51953 RepID=UPI003C6DB058
MSVVEFCYPKICSDPEKNIKSVETSLYSPFNEYVKEYNESLSHSHSSSVPSSSSVNMGFEFDNEAITPEEDDFVACLRTRDVEGATKSELDRYLDEAEHACEPGAKFDALKWWQVCSFKFPVLSKMAKGILSVPMTTVASASTFSAGGRVIDAYIVHLLERIQSKLLFMDLIGLRLRLMKQ